MSADNLDSLTDDQLSEAFAVEVAKSRGSLIFGFTLRVLFT